MRVYARYGCRIPPLAPGQSAARWLGCFVFKYVLEYTNGVDYYPRGKNAAYRYNRTAVGVSRAVAMVLVRAKCQVRGARSACCGRWPPECASFVVGAHRQQIYR
jgi:hypothetical protein